MFCVLIMMRRKRPQSRGRQLMNDSPLLLMNAAERLLSHPSLQAGLAGVRSFEGTSREIDSRQVSLP